MAGKRFMNRLLLSTVMVSAAAMGQAVAQDDSDDKIVVTGSRIAKQDFTSTSPVATIGEAQFEITSTVNTESLLNTLPQTIPGLDRTSNNPGGGIATVNLRGLGTNRTLVLIDGKRAVPNTSGGTVDINTIPTALIRDVEVLTGGASAIYGSDAVAGVVNFILKDDFEGLELASSYELTEQSDAGILSVEATFGANLDGGRGNVVLNMSYTDRDDLFQGDRDFATFAQFDDGEGNLFDGGSSGIPGTSIFSGAVGDDPATTANCASFGITFDQDGSVRCFQTGDNNDFYNYAPVNYIQLPQERYQATALAHYDVTDDIQAYGKFLYSYSRVPQQLAATPIFQTATFSIDGSPFLTTGSQSLLSEAFGDGVDTDMDGVDDTGTAFVRRRLLEVGPRIVDDLNESFMVQAGVRGNLMGNWTYDAYLQEGRTTVSSTQSGNVNRDRFNQALLLDPADPTQCADPSANGSTISCSPLNIFGEGNISDDAAAFLRTAVAAVGEYHQTIVSGDISGDFGDTLRLPGGPIGAAFGVEYIDQEFDFRPSQDLAAGTIAGFNGQPAVSGGYDSISVYGELFLPILSDVDFVDSLEVELAARYSDYSTIGGVDAMKVGVSWQVDENVRLRGSFNTAVRAPNIGELFSPQGEGFPGAGDPCSASGAPAGGLDQFGIDTCVATGVPAALVGSPALNPAAGQIRQLSGGNPDLIEESAETFTVGAVFTPSMVDGLTVSVDYFDIEIEDAISAFGGGTNNVLQNCYTNTDLGGAGSPFCDVVTRRADGTIDFVSILSQNVAVVTLKGVDVQAEYSRDVGAGLMSVNYLGTYTQESDFTPFAGADVIECAGEFGADCGEPTPEYKHRVTVAYDWDKWNTQLLWRRVGQVDDDGGLGFTLAVNDIDATDYFDLATSYDVNDNLRMSFGIDNLLDEEPPILGDNQEQANTFPATYDVYGRTYFVRGSLKF